MKHHTKHEIIAGTIVVIGVALLVAVVLYLTGCGSGLQPNLQRNTTSMPRVSFVGDEISTGLVEAVANPLWTCDDCAQGATSSQVLANFGQALAVKPDVIHILVGTYDVLDPAWTLGCGEDGITCTNIAQMITQAHAQGIKVILGTIPPIGPGPLAAQLDPTGQASFFQFRYNNYALELWDFERASTDPAYTDQIVSYDALLAQNGASSGEAYQPMFTQNGIDPALAGYLVMYPATYQAVENLHVKIGVR